MNSKIEELQKQISLNMVKAVALANKNVIRDSRGFVVLKKRR